MILSITLQHLLSKNRLQPFRQKNNGAVNTTAPLLYSYYTSYNRVCQCDILLYHSKTGIPQSAGSVGSTLKAYIYLLVLPKPPFLTSVQSSSNVMPYSVNIPCAKASPALREIVSPVFEALVNLIMIWPSLSE